ncbi:MAG TPA: GyrI-like domain-containing protein [Patescibacteria group bacterium]|nr:GyrI-like domain-containing protein [Patescibacteria group bacterium]
MIKLDYKKECGQQYAAKVNQPVIIDVPPLNYLMIDGKGNPNTSQEYIDAIQTLYPVAYMIKFMCKKELGTDFSVMPLEGLWWSKDMGSFSSDNKDNWQWTAMIMLPEFVTKDIYQRAVRAVATKKSPKSLSKLQFQEYEEGRAAQIMHVGPYANEAPTIRQLHAFIKANGGKLGSTDKHHHEIYLGDPRRTDPSKLKTIIRQPF